jgi:hypothetical protein
MAPLVYWPVTVSLGETGRSEAAPWSFRREWPGGELGGRLHRDQREELQHVVLHHVAQRARAVIEAHAAFKAHGFGHGDLHMLDMRGVPQRLEHDVGKAQRQKVLHRFLAQIVVDAEDAVFGEGARHGIVDHLGGGQIGAQRLFKADAALLIGQAAVDQPAMVGSNRLGAVDRKIARPCSTSPTFLASAWKWVVSLASSGW